MALPTLESLTARLDRTCADILGEEVEYAADGSTFETVQGHVNYRDAAASFEGSEVIAQDITVSVLKADVPAKPTRTARIQLAKHPGRLFQPIGPRTDDSGTGWEFELRDIPDA